MYQLINPRAPETEVNYVRLGNQIIPFDPSNSDYQTYLKWLEEGNTPLPADAPNEE